jgi:hypothetical protein
MAGSTPRPAPTNNYSPARAGAFEVKVKHGHGETLLRQWRDETRPAAIERLRHSQRLDRQRLSDAELLRPIHHLLDEATVLLTVWP